LKNWILKYKLSYTAASLAINETISISKLYILYNDWEEVNRRVFEDHFLPKNKEASSKRILKEITNRLKNLTQDEVLLLSYSDFLTQKQLCYLGVCKTYRLIREFMVEVIRNKYQLFDYQIIESDYGSFYYEKSSNHPELEQLGESTQKKLKQVMFKIMEQAGIIASAKNRIIQPQHLSEKLVEVIIRDNPDYLKIFLLSDQQVLQLKTSYAE